MIIEYSLGTDKVIEKIFSITNVLWTDEMYHIFVFTIKTITILKKILFLRCFDYFLEHKQNCKTKLGYERSTPQKGYDEQS